MNKNNNIIIKKSDLEKCLSEFFNLNLEDLLRAKLNGNFKEEMFYKGFLGCILCFADNFNISIKNIDKLDIIDYI